MSGYYSVSRRGFLHAAAGGLAATGLPAGIAEGQTSRGRTRRPLDPNEFKQRLRGPILSVPTPFASDFKVDEPGVQNLVGRALQAGVKNFALTAGNSQYHCLGFDEIKRLTAVLVESAGDAGIVIACAGEWWTGRTREYVRYAESVGADAVQVMLPKRADADAQVHYFRKVAGSTNLGLVLAGNYPIPLLERLVEIDQVVALKEDVTLVYYIDVQRRFGDRLTVFAGGPKYRFLTAQPYGSRAFYSLFATFAPQIPMRFWRAVQDGDQTLAYEIVKKYEHPLFERWSHAFWRACLEYFGVAQRYLRPPERSFTDAQMAEVRAFFDGLGLRPPGRPESV
jgi:4-hydroxy-tetrahydrodipicolinate synthase